MIYRPVLLFVLISACTLQVFAQATASKAVVKVSGEVTKPLSLSIKDLSKMKHVPVSMKDRDGAIRNYSGVPVAEILQTAGATMGRELRGENLSKYMMVKCADGYEVVFSLAELDSSFTDRQIALVYELEGKPLVATQGPFRLIVPGEKKPARSCQQVTDIIVRYGKE